MQGFIAFINALTHRLPFTDLFNFWFEANNIPFMLFLDLMVVGFSIYLVRRVLF